MAKGHCWHDKKKKKMLASPLTILLGAPSLKAGAAAVFANNLGLIEEQPWTWFTSRNLFGHVKHTAKTPNFFKYHKEAIHSYQVSYLLILPVQLFKAINQ